MATKAKAKTAPRFKSDMKQARSRTGRGNEHVTNDDVSRVAEQETTNRWDRIPNAIEYLRRYVVHLEALAENKDKALTPDTVVKLMDQVHKFKEDLSKIVKSPAEKVFDLLRFVVAPAIFEDADTTAITVEGVGRCNIMDDIGVIIKGSNKEEKDRNKEAFCEWLIENELEDLITQTINAQTLAAFVRRQLKDRDGLKLPYKLIEVKPITRAQITR